MRTGIRLAALVLAMLAGVSAAMAAGRDIEGGVTVLRGGGVMQNTGPAVQPTGPTGTSDGSGSGGGGGGGGYSFDKSGAVNAVRTGSSNAGGENANPPPGAGR